MVRKCLKILYTFSQNVNLLLQTVTRAVLFSSENKCIHCVLLVIDQHFWLWYYFILYKIFKTKTKGLTGGLQELEFVSSLTWLWYFWCLSVVDLRLFWNQQFWRCRAGMGYQHSPRGLINLGSLLGESSLYSLCSPASNPSTSSTLSPILRSPAQVLIHFL